MPKQFWINLSTRQLDKSIEFFKHIGFTVQQNHSPHQAELIIGDNEVLVVLFPENTFQQFTENPLTNTSESSEVLFSIDAQSREEVDELAKKAEHAGGTIFSKPAEKMGFMYGCGFTDLDGHRWNVLYMDMSKAPQG